MSQLQQLINQMCPNGVEWKMLGDVLKYEQPAKYIVKSTDYSNEGTPVLTAGASFILGYTDEVDGIYNASKDAPVIIFDDFTTSFHWVDFDFKVKSSAMKMLKPINGGVNFRYVYYSMSIINYVPAEHSRQWIGKYSRFSIPLPPLEIQSRIVEILDHFTNLTANLTAELNLRRKQFEHYRENLLALDGVDGVEWKTIGEECEIHGRIGWQGLTKKDYRTTGNYLLVTGTDFLSSYKINYDTCVFIDEDRYTQDKYIQLKEDDLLITKDGTIGKLAIVQDLPMPATLNGGVFVIRSKTGKLVHKFLMYIMASSHFKNQIEQKHTNGTIKHLTQNLLVNYTIPVPPLAVQQSIVEKLDKFTALIEDIDSELALRQKQYEYYRNQLLTF